MGLLDGIGMAIDLTEGICNVLRPLSQSSKSCSSSNVQCKKNIVIGPRTDDWMNDEPTKSAKDIEIENMQERINELENELAECERKKQDEIDEAVRKERDEHVIIITDM